MRSNSDFFNEFNQAAQKELRLVIVIDFPTPLYLTSHAGIPNIPAGQIDDVVQDVSSISQRLNPDQGRSEIGSLSFSLIDKASAITDRFRSEQAAGEGLKGRKVELYRGGANIAGGVDTDWTEFRVEQTVQIESAVVYEKGAYKISCSDIQREMRRDIFDLAKTRLRSSFNQGATTIDVFDTDDFEPCDHTASFGDQPTGSFFYFKIKYQNGFEIVRATGKTGGATPTFTGCVRGLFGTLSVNHVLTAETGPTTGIEIEEYVYLELPAPAMAVALLTGNIPGGGTLPSRWNLGIPAAFINQSSFDDIGIDWFDLADYTKGLIFRFQSIKKTDGKRFIEREVCLLAGAFLLIGGDGRISMRRMTGVISTADFVIEIGVDNAIAHGPMKHDLSKVRNLYDIEWSYLEFPGESKPRFIRRDILVDATSIGLHGEAKPLPLQFKGLHNDRHTFTTLINRFDALRDRYAGPPLTMRVDLMPHLNDLEVGDIVRAVFPNVRDFTGTDTLDRSFEIQRIAINQKTGRVTAELFGSSLKADPIADEDAGTTSELPNGWYDSEGTAADATLSIDGSGFLLSSGSLVGGSTTRTIFYVLGNFTIPAGLSVGISGNVELRVRGLLQINGTLGSTGGGMPANTAGFIGFTFGGRGVLLRGPTPGTFSAQRVGGQNAAMPVIEIENNAGVLDGVPPDMRGTGGGTGGGVKQWEPNFYAPEAAGGVGGSGGPSIVTVSRGVAYGVSGKTIVNGSPGLVGASFSGHDAGSGGGGAPGAMMHLLDGRDVLFPILAGNIGAGYGTSPILNSNLDTQGKAKASDPISLGVSNGRVAYVPDSRDPYPIYVNDEINDADGNSIIVATAYLRKATAPATPIADDGQYNFSTNVLTPPSIGGGSADNWSATVPAGTDPLYVTQGTFEIQGVSGIDATVLWTVPVILVSDGDDGAPGAPGGDGNSVHVASVFLRKATAPTTPIADDGAYNFGTNVLTPPSTGGGSADNWSVTVPAGSDPLYVCNGTFEINGVTGIDSTVTWSAPVILASDGADGSAGGDGNSVHVGTVFRRFPTTVPATPTADDGQYNFTTNVLTPPASWSITVPVGTDPLYVCNGTFEISGATGIDSTVTWSAPVLMTGDGLSSVPDFNPGKLGGGSDFVFTLNAINGGASNDGEIRVEGDFFEHPDGTSISTDVSDFAIHTFYEGVNLGRFYLMFSAIAGETRFGGVAGDWGAGDDTRFLVVTHDDANGWRARNNSGTYFSFTPIATDCIIAAVEKVTTSGGLDSMVSFLGGIQGVVGGDGNSVHVGQVFLRKASVPTTPIANDGQYNFTTTTLTPPSIGGGSADNWSIDVPAGSDPLYVSAGTFEINGITGIDSTVAWSAPVILASDGADGATGGIGPDGETGSPGYALSYTYDDLDTTGEAAGPSRYAMLTARLTETSGDQNDFQNTDAILINKFDLASAHDLQDYYSSLVIGDRITFYVTADRWYLYEIDELVGTTGSGSTLRYNFGVQLIDFAEDSNANISTAAGTPILFQFGRAETGNFRDAKFKRSATVPATPTGDNPAGWFDQIPAGVDAIYQIVGTKTFGGKLIGVWSTPERIGGLVYRGTYLAGTAYLPLDVVAFSERTYINTLASTGIAPTGTNGSNANWDLLAGKGDPGDPPSLFDETIVIQGPGPIDLRAAANAHTPAYDGVSDATIVFTLAGSEVPKGTAGAVDGGAGGHGINTGTWPAVTLDLTLEITGTVRSGGGGGGAGGDGFGSQNGGNGGVGGDAIFCQEVITVDVKSGGVVQAAGGGGGGGAGASHDPIEPLDYGGGGGGGGFPSGLGGSAGSGLGASAGAAGTSGGGGAGGGGGLRAGDGGNGGNVNVNGVNGQNGTGDVSNGSPGSGGARGFAIRKNGHVVTVINNGTITGTQG